MRTGRYIPPAGLILGLVLLATFLLQLCYLGHTSLTRWDEVFHAIVAQNVFKHPFEPTLVDVPYLPFDYTNWRENHVWLHKPILPFWQVALSFAFFGVNTFALRLPAAILSTGAAWLTYLIGKDLFGRGAALIAAVLQAINPFIVTLVQGYQFADNIDIALLFWVEVGIFFLMRAVRTGSWRDVILAGVAQGLAFLSKSYLAGIILGVALTACLLPICRLGKREDNRFGVLHLFVLFYATLVTVAPWVIYCLVSYPREFWAEEEHVWQHLHTGVSVWGAPWTKVVFDYLISIYGVFYTPTMVAAIILFGTALARRHTGLWLTFAWGLGVIVPHLLAHTKTPSATLLAVPPFLLLLGYFIDRAWRGELAPLAALTGVLIMSLAVPALIRNPEDGSPGLNGNLEQSGWVLIHVAGALEIAALVAIAWLLIHYRTPGSTGFLGRYVQWPAIVFCLVVLTWLGWRAGRTAWAVASANISDPYSLEAGRFARAELPANAVLLCEEYKSYEHLCVMFYADRTCYALDRGGSQALAQRILQNGGLPYIVSYQQLPYVPVYVSPNRGPKVYRWQLTAP